MPTSYTDKLRIALQATGENNNTWGVIVNQNVIEILEDAIAGILELNVTAGNVTLTTANGLTDQARNAIIKVTGTPTAARTVTVPTISKVYVVHNDMDAAFNVVFTTGSGSTITLAQNEVAIIYCDGNELFAPIYNNIMRTTNNLSDLASASTARTNLGLGDLADKNAGDGLEIVGSVVNATAIPVGTLFPWATTTAPDKFLMCEGQAVSRVTYADLFALWGTQFGAGDGTTTFNLLDFRGEFWRGFDNGAGIDPDAATRTDRGDGTTGDAIGTKQLGEVGDHTHSQNSASTYQAGVSPGGALATRGTAGGDLRDPGVFGNGGSETRPRNIALPMIVYAGV